MSLKDIFSHAARLNTAKEGEALPTLDAPFHYTELFKEGRFQVRLSSNKDTEAYIECSVPDDGFESSQNYCRVQFLSMTFKAAIAGMKRKKRSSGPAEAAAPWIAKIYEYCQAKNLSPITLMAFHKKWESAHKEQQPPKTDIQ